MKKIEDFIKDIANDVREEMKWNIENGFDHLYWEHEVGTALIVVEVSEVRLRNGSYIDDTDVYVQHENPEHTSPTLERAIWKALPNWFDLKDEIDRLSA